MFCNAHSKTLQTYISTYAHPLNKGPVSCMMSCIVIQNLFENSL